MSDGPNPRSSALVNRRRLRTELRRARSGVNLTQDQVASSMEWSLSKVIRIENGNVSISVTDLRALLSFYNIRDRERVDELLELSRMSRQTSWWSQYRGIITPQYLQYIEYEEAASFLRAYQPILLPGLLQTEEYAGAIIRRFAPAGTSAQLIRDLIEIRMTRQNLLEQTAAPTLSCLLDEAVIRHIVGERNSAEGQVAKLIQMANRPNVTIEVVPFEMGLYRGMLEAYLYLEFPDAEDSDVVFIESPTRDTLISNDDEGEVSSYREVFEQVRSMSMGPSRTLDYLSNLSL